MFNYYQYSIISETVRSSNARQVRCEDSLSKCLYDHCQSDDLDLHSKSQMRLELDYLLTCNISDNIEAITCIQTGHDGRLMHGIHTHFDDFDFDFENV